MAKKKTATAASAPPVDWEAWFKAEEKKHAEKKKNALRVIKDLAVEMHARGITRFIVEYNGEGDSGDVSDTDYMKHASFGAKKITDIKEAERQAFIEAAWLFVPSGFENNEGGYGTIIFDFVKSAIEFEHNQRYTEVNTTLSQFNFDGEET